MTIKQKIKSIELDVKHRKLVKQKMLTLDRLHAQQFNTKDDTDTARLARLMEQTTQSEVVFLSQLQAEILDLIKTLEGR